MASALGARQRGKELHAEITSPSHSVFEVGRFAFSKQTDAFQIHELVVWRPLPAQRCSSQRSNVGEKTDGENTLGTRGRASCVASQSSMRCELPGAGGAEGAEPNILCGLPLGTGEQLRMSVTLASFVVSVINSGGEKCSL